ncbi:MAG: hypothetical protein E6Q97_18050 [Desulfurellales bacterium]|nr:MAG: hypothetical protein E6Q97_18050 [Desulfurellales bacterium]
MKRILTLIAALVAITALAQFTTAITTSVRITGTPNQDDRRWLRLVVSNENLRRINSGDPVLATNLLPEATGLDLKNGAEVALSNILANAIQSYSEQAAQKADDRLTRQQWLQIKAAIEERMSAGTSAETIVTDVAN